MLKKLEMQKFEKISDLDKLISKDEIHKFGRTYHFNAIAINQKGLKNLFEIRWNRWGNRRRTSWFQN